MKYLVIENKEQTQNRLLDQVADFLWNNGNEVFISSSTQKDHFTNDYDCIVLLMDGDFVVESFFENDCKALYGHFDLEESDAITSVLIFSTTGVYSNAIPFPHKIYHFSSLDYDALLGFFNWTRRLNLFTTVPVCL